MTARMPTAAINTAQSIERFQSAGPPPRREALPSGLRAPSVARATVAELGIRARSDSAARTAVLPKASRNGGLPCARNSMSGGLQVASRRSVAGPVPLPRMRARQ